MIHELHKIFVDNSNEDYALAMSKYLRFKFQFYGIKKPERVILQKSYFLRAKSLKINDLFEIIFEAFESEYREMHHFGIELLRASTKKYRDSDIENLEKLVQMHSWWDSVDSIAMAIGHYFKMHPSDKEKIIYSWISNNNIWLNRVAIIFQLKYKTETNLSLLAKIILKLKDKNEFFIQKAIGWVLREYSKTDPNWVMDFIDNNNITGLAKREGLKKILIA